MFLFCSCSCYLKKKSLPFQQCLRLDPDNRPTCTELVKHSLFTRDGFGSRYPIELKHKLQKEHMNNPLYKTSSSSLDGAETDNRDAEGTSKMGTGAGAAGKKKKKSESKEASGASFSKELRKESTTLTKDIAKKVGDMGVCSHATDVDAVVDAVVLLLCLSFCQESTGIRSVHPPPPFPTPPPKLKVSRMEYDHEVMLVEM